MKLGHAAALALVVYLLVPPFNGGPDSLACDSGSTAACLRQTFNPEAPIGNWRLLQAFDTAEAYKTFRDDRIQMLEKCPGRDEVQKYDGLEIKENIDAIGSAVQARILKLTRGTPFTIISVVIGNIQYPKTVADSVANKLAATQVLEQTTIEIQIAKAKAQIREAEAEGVAKAMDTINQKLTPLYVQYEAIQAQQKMVNSPNHTEVYIPVGPMGVPVVGTMKLGQEGKQ